jgi:predicted membrane protein
MKFLIARFGQARINSSFLHLHVLLRRYFPYFLYVPTESNSVEFLEYIQNVNFLKKIEIIFDLSWLIIIIILFYNFCVLMKVSKTKEQWYQLPITV